MNDTQNKYIDELMKNYNLFQHYEINPENRTLEYKNKYYIRKDVMPEISEELEKWIWNWYGNGKKLRKNAKIPKEFTHRNQIFEDWKKNVSEEDLVDFTNQHLLRAYLAEITYGVKTGCDFFQDLKKERIYYAQQYEKEKCTCKYSRGKKKFECRQCILSLSIYENDENFKRLIRLFEKNEDIVFEEVADWYIVCNKNYDSAKDTIMADHDIEDSQIQEEIPLIEDDLVEIIEKPITGSKRTREEAEIIDLDEYCPSGTSCLDQQNNPFLFIGLDNPFLFV